MRTVNWVRHGPTHEKAFVGWRDVPADLSDSAMVARLSVALPLEAVVVASDLQRASKTADAIAGQRRRHTDLSDLREFDFGDWDGLTFDQVNSRDSALSRRFWEEPGDLRAPNGESWNEVSKRTSTAVDRLLETYDGDLIVVAHIGVIMTQIARSGVTAYHAMGHRIDNLSVTQLHLDRSGWRLGRVNHIS